MPNGSSAAVSRADVAAIVRRAVQVHQQSGDAADASGLDLAATAEVLRELGVSSTATEQALAEWRAGTLETTDGPSGTGAWSARATAVRVVPLPFRDARTRLDALLHRECFVPAGTSHDIGTTVETWVARGGLGPRLRRSLDMSGNLALNDVARLEVTLRPALAGSGTHLRLSTSLEPVRSRLLGGFVGVPLVVTAAAMATGPELIDLVGAALTGGGGIVAQRRLGGRRLALAERLQVVLARVTAG